MIGLRRRPLQTGIIDDITGPAVDRMLDEAHPETAPPEIEFTLDETDPQPAALPNLIDDTRADAHRGPMNFVHEPIRSAPPQPEPLAFNGQTDDPWANEEPLSPDMLRTAQSRANGIESGKLPGFAADDDGEAVASSAPLTMNKGGQNPFAVSPEDKQRMQQAERADRRGRIARGILSALGGVTQIGASLAGGSPIAALGQGLYGVGQGVPTNRVAQEQGRQDRNAQQATRYAAYDQQQTDRASELERQAAQDAFRRQESEATIGLRQAQTEQARIRSQQMQDEWSQVSGNRTAAIQWLRTLAGQYPNAPIAREVLAGTNEGGPLWNASLDQLSDYARQFSTLASSGQVAGRAGIGQAPGGGGVGGPSLAPSDPVRAANAGVEIPSSVTGPERDIYVDAVNRGLDDPMNAVLRYRASPPAVQQQTWQASIGRNESRQAGRFVLSEGLNQEQWYTHQTRLDRANAVRDAVRSAAHRIDSMIAQHGEIAVRAALNGDNRLANIMGQDLATLRAAIGRATAAYRLEMTGQGSSAAEQNSLLQNLNMGSFASDPRATADSLRTLGDERLNTAKAQTPPDYVSEWLRRNREAYERSHPQ